MSDTHVERKIKLILHSLSAAAENAVKERPLPEDLGKPQYRRMRSDDAKSGYDAENHTVTLTISSEFPVERWDGTEILVHEPSAIDASRLDEGISHLYNHNWDTLLGRTTSYEIANKKLSVTSKYGTNTDAKQREQDLADGILPDVSLGYQILKVEVTEDKDGNRSYRVVRWMPYEWSSVIRGHELRQAQIVGLANWTIDWKRKGADSTTTDDAEYARNKGSTKSWSVKADYMFIDGDTSQNAYIMDALDNTDDGIRTWNLFPTVEQGRTAFQGGAFIDGITWASGIGKVLSVNVSSQETVSCAFWRRLPL